ncbi:MAG: TRAP transporter small permease [Clostridiales bacterium]|nr:TRAP transporter small permease [Clostridiales bacterium]
MSKIRGYLRHIVRVEQSVCCLLLVTMLAVCFAAVILRYAFGKPLVWSEEVILTLLIWFGFLCISIGAFGDTHIAIEGAYNLFPPVLRRFCDLLRHVLLMVFGGMMVYFGWQVFHINLLKRLPATHWPQGIQYFPIVFGGLLTAVYSAVNLIECLSGKRERKEGSES